MTATPSIAEALGGRVHVVDEVQRNWSRVASATLDGRRIFVKQFVDRSGRRHERGFAGDMTTHRELVQPGALPAAVRVPDLLDTVPEHLIAIYEHESMTTVDDLLDQPTVGAVERIGQSLRKLLDHRRGADGIVRLWKGLDPKNLGLADDGDGVVVFDLGPALHLPTQEAAERICAYVLAAAWRASRPIDWVLARPDTRRALTAMVAPLCRDVDAGRVRDELNTLFDLRRREPQRPGAVGRVTPGIARALGPIYTRRALRLLSATTPLPQEGIRT